MSSAQTDTPEYAPFFGAMGAASAIIFSGKLQCHFRGFNGLSKRIQESISKRISPHALRQTGLKRSFSAFSKRPQDYILNGSRQNWAQIKF